MGKRILIISPTPTHPTNAGNRIRILNMVSHLVSIGHEVHFLYSRQENADENAMQQFWGNRFYAVDYKKPVFNKSELLKRKFLRFIYKDHRYYSHVDDYYNELLDDRIREIHSIFSFEVVLVEYIFLSRAFLNFGKRVIKVLDTHDVMTDRHKLFLKEGKKPVWYSVPYGQERKGVRRADVVIAIQEKEKGHFSRMTGKKVVNIGHLVKIAEPVSGIPRLKLLFVGSDNPSNLYGIQDFIKDYFPGIRNIFPGLELIVAGNICNRLPDVPEGVKLLGELEDLAEAYDQADIVINPLTIGTGLKIKMIEALGLSKVVLSTPVGAEGLETAGTGYLLYRNAGEFSEMLHMVLSSQGNYREVTTRAKEIAEDWNKKNAGIVHDIFSCKDFTTKSIDFSDAGMPDDKLAGKSFDDALSTRPEIQKFVIISIPRSGSNLLVGILNNSQEIICFSELFHPNAIFDAGLMEANNIPVFSIESRNENPGSLLKYIYQQPYTKPVKTIGFKIFPGHNDHLLNSMILNKEIKKIVLIRENYLLNFVSFKTANATKVFYVKSGSENPVKEAPISINFKEFLNYEKKQKAFFNNLIKVLTLSGQVFLEVHYEDLLKPVHQKEFLQFLNVSQELCQLKINSRKQNNLPLEKKITNYEELRIRLINSGREEFLSGEKLDA